VIVGVLIAALAAPAFLGYRIQRTAEQPLRCTKTPLVAFGGPPQARREDNDYLELYAPGKASVVTAD
jgi:hypothetical protein